MNRPLTHHSITVAGNPALLPWPVPPGRAAPRTLGALRALVADHTRHGPRARHTCTVALPRRGFWFLLLWVFGWA